MIRYDKNSLRIAVVGAGFAGCEAAARLAKDGYNVTLYEMKPKKFSPAHKIADFAELVCSNSFKAKRLASAAGLLKEEMRMLDSVCISVALETSVNAGGALAVDRNLFSSRMTEIIKNIPNIEIINQEVFDFPKADAVIIAAGPLISNGLSNTICKLTGTENLSFFDAAAPIITKESIDMDFAFLQSRYDNGNTNDYINCPMNKEQYELFYNELINAERVVKKSFEKGKDVYEGCMPIEVLAGRGKDAARYGPLKPVGLINPKTNHRPWANLQLRRENREGTLYNLVGFQTNLKFPEQKRVFSMFEALKNAEFVRYGVMHRNTFLNSPKVLNYNNSLKINSNIFFAGQITGVEGYMESASSGIFTAIQVERYLNGLSPIEFSKKTMIGALASYLNDETTKSFQPMGANFGIIPPLDENERDKKKRYEKLSERALGKLKKLIEIAELRV